MVGKKITRPRDGRHKSNSPKGGTDGELYGRQENNLPKDRELNGLHKNNSPKLQRDGRTESYTFGTKITPKSDGQRES